MKNLILVIILLLIAIPVHAETYKVYDGKTIVLKTNHPCEELLSSGGEHDKWSIGEYGDAYRQCWVNKKFEKAIPAQQSFIGNKLELLLLIPQYIS